MVKTFQNFEKTGSIEKEKEALERELNARKKKREYMGQYSFGDIQNLIVHELQTNIEHHITMGDRTTNLDGSVKEVLHIEYESQDLGRIRIYLPEDTSLTGFLDVNGNVSKHNASEIRELFHLLKQEIKEEPIIEKLDDNLIEKPIMAKKKIVSVESTDRDWCGVYVDGNLYIEGIDIGWMDLLKTLQDTNVNILEYFIVDTPIYVDRNILRKFGFSLPLTLAQLCDNSGIQYTTE